EDFGLKVENAESDFGAVIKRSRNVAKGMSNGIGFLMKKNKIDVIEGTAKVKKGKKIAVTDSKDKTTEYQADHIIIATGARSRELPNIKQDSKNIIGYREALTLKELPKRMLVVGSGAIGSEF